VAILLPLTFSMSPTSAIVMLSCIYWGALFGGAITSILFNIPGEPWSVATTFDGYPMAQKGKAGQALTAAFTSSFVGALVAVLMITFLAPLVAKFALKFGAPEFFAVYLLTFCSFVGMGKGSPFKILISMALGFALAAVGMDTVTGQLRLTFGQTELMRGFDFLIAVIGLFGIGEILLSMEEGLSFSGKSARINPKVVWETWKELPRYWTTSVRSALVGIWMGITPGGATPASFMSYGLAKKFSRNGPKFGTGEIEGVIAPETAAHAAGTSALLPMLALGIPGSPTAAVLLGPDREHVPGQRRRPDRRIDDSAAVRVDPAHSVLDHRAGDHRHLRDRRLHCAQRDARHLVHAWLRCYRLRLQETRLPARAAGAGAGARRQGRRLVSPVDAGVAGRRDDHVVQRPGRLDHDAGAGHAVLAADLEVAAHAPAGQGR
jgi:hypothetical protein